MRRGLEEVRIGKVGVRWAVTEVRVSNGVWFRYSFTEVRVR